MLEDKRFAGRLRVYTESLNYKLWREVKLRQVMGVGRLSFVEAETLVRVRAEDKR